MNLTLFLLPLISAFIGWLLMWIIIKMLFHPVKPTKISGITFQGVFPKKQEQLAIKTGKLVSSQIFSFTDIEQKIADPENVSKLLPVLETHIDIFLREKLPVQIPMLGMLIGDKTITQVKGVFIKELEELFPMLMKQYIHTLKNDFDLEKIITEKLKNLSFEKVEETFNKIMFAELTFLKITGAVIGFIIGLLQIFLTITAM